MRVTSDHIGSQRSLYLVMNKYVSPTAHFSMQWCIPIGKWLSQVSKNIKLTTYKGKQLQLKWRCHNDAAIPKVEL